MPDFLKPFIVGVPEESLSIPKEINFTNFKLSRFSSEGNGTTSYVIPKGKKILITNIYAQTLKSDNTVVAGPVNILTISTNTETLVNHQWQTIESTAGLSKIDDFVFNTPKEIYENQTISIVIQGTAFYEIRGYLVGYIIDI